MEIYSSDDDVDRLSERLESYSLSADVSESESSTSSFSRRQLDHEAGTSSSIASSPLPGPLFGETSVLSARLDVKLPAFGGRNVVVPKTEKNQSELPGSSVQFLLASVLAFAFVLKQVGISIALFLIFWYFVVLCVITEVELMKERFAKLLLGEDMSGGSKGVCTSLAISNAITNLSGLFIASSFFFCAFIF